MLLPLLENADEVLSGLSDYYDLSDASASEVLEERMRDELVVTKQDGRWYIALDPERDLRAVEEDRVWIVRLAHLEPIFDGGKEALEKALQENGIEYDWFEVQPQ